MGKFIMSKRNIRKLTPTMLKSIIQEEKIKLAKELKIVLLNEKARKNKFKNRILKEAIRELIEIKKQEVAVGKKYKKLYEKKEKLKHNILKRMK